MSNKQKFKDDIEKASQLAEVYNGTEAGFKELFGSLEALEAWFGKKPTEKNSIYQMRKDLLKKTSLLKKYRIPQVFSKQLPKVLAS